MPKKGPNKPKITVDGGEVTIRLNFKHAIHLCRMMGHMIKHLQVEKTAKK